MQKVVYDRAGKPHLLPERNIKTEEDDIAARKLDNPHLSTSSSPEMSNEVEDTDDDEEPEDISTELERRREEREKRRNFLMIEKKATALTAKERRDRKGRRAMRARDTRREEANYKRDRSKGTFD